MSNATKAADLLTKSSYCRNSKHTRCKTAECACKCHAEIGSGQTVQEAIHDVVERVIDADAAEEAAVAAKAEEAYQATNGTPEPETETVPDSAEIEAVRTEVQAETGCGGCDNGEDCGMGCTDDAIAAARKLVEDRLTNAPEPKPVPAKKAKAPKAPKEPKPVVKGTVDGKLSNAHKRAIRVQMVAYLAAMPVELTGDLEGVTPDEAAAYVDQYWVKYIDPARDKARHSK